MVRVILPPPALRSLALLKFKAVWRQQLRRMKRPSGLAFAFLGLMLFGFWITALVFGFTGRRASMAGMSDLRLPLVQLGSLFLTFMTVVGSLNHRGLYLPKEEIERLFSSPIARSDLVRYRLITSMGRSVFAVLIFWLLSWRWLPNPLFGFFGILVSLVTLPIVGQASSLLVGGAENRLSRMLLWRRLKVLPALMGILFGLGIAGFFFRESLQQMLQIDSGQLEGQARQLLQQPIVRGILAPFLPWASMITAEQPTVFLGWFALCLVLWVALFELTARIPVDYRELSLATSADVAKRMRRMSSRGFGASSGRVSRHAAGRPVPWLFGRGPFGAVAWLKLASIVRKARGTMLVSLGIVGCLTVFATLVSRYKFSGEHWIGAAMIAGIGVFYLCGGLRFDFRTELDQMTSIKAWPLSASRIFLAMLLPEVCLVSALLVAAILVHSAVAGAFGMYDLLIIAFLPLFTMGWVAVDNVVFLFAPVRFIPGQEGALHHAGRSFVLMFLRGILLLVLVGAAALAATAATKATYSLIEPGVSTVIAVAASAAWITLFGLVAALIALGGYVFERFDVARDRG